MNTRREFYLVVLLYFFIIAFLSNVSILDATSGENQKMGVIVISHGAPIPDWNDTVARLVSSVNSPHPVEAAFMDFDAERSLEKCVMRLEKKGVNQILVVHLSPSSYSSHHEELKYLLGFRKDLGVYTEMTDKPINSTVKKFALSPCMDDHYLIVDILKEYARELSTEPQNESFILIGHGPVEEVENIMWVRQLQKIAKEISQELKFREIVCMNLRNDAADLVREQARMDLRQTAQRLSAHGKVIVVTYALGSTMLQNEIKHVLNRIPSVAISMKGMVSHPKTVKWIEYTISNGMNQPQVPPINRKWSIMDRELGNPLGTYRFGLL